MRKEKLFSEDKNDIVIVCKPSSDSDSFNSVDGDIISI